MEECTAQLQDVRNTQEEIQRILTRIYLILVRCIPTPLQSQETSIPDHVWTLMDMLFQLILTPNQTVRIRELSLSVLQEMCQPFQDVCDKICLDPAAKLDALVELVRNDPSHAVRAAFWSLMGHIAAHSVSCHPRLLSLLDMCVQTIPSIPPQNDLSIITTFHCIRFLGNLSVHSANHTFLIHHAGVLPILTNYLNDPVVDLAHMTAIFTCANLGVDVSLQHLSLLVGSLETRVLSTLGGIGWSNLMQFTDVKKLLYTFSRLLKDPVKRLFLREAGLCKVIEQILIQNNTFQESIPQALECLWLLYQ